VLDVCTALTERTDEDEQMATIVKKLAQSVRAPLMIDSTETKVIEAALKIYAGRRSSTRSTSKTAARSRPVMPLVKEAAPRVVALTIDETGWRRRPSASSKSPNASTTSSCDEYGIPPGALIFDALTFTLATGRRRSSRTRRSRRSRASADQGELARRA
jgi:5-methyltetrahydrofolate--homocysteine methyltransferase